MSSLSKYGLPSGHIGGLRRVLLRQSLTRLRIFPVPGLSLLLLEGFDPDRFGWEITATPREASVLLVSGPLPDGLTSHVATAYAAMPRPRILVFHRLEPASALPPPDIVLPPGEWAELPRLINTFDFHGEAAPFALPSVDNVKEDRPAHHEHGHHDHGDHRDHHEHHDHGDHRDHHEHHDHQHHNGFMSMIAMTKDMPRSPDGLPMDRNQVHFGPFHPGISDGLLLTLTLDGDTVVTAECQNPACQSKAPLDRLLSATDPFQPLTYQCLAYLASIRSDRDFPATIRQLEQERILNHLFWLHRVLRAAGDKSLVRQVRQGILAINQGSSHNPEPLLTRIRKRKYLKPRLRKTGILPERLLHHVNGPAAKAAGKSDDCRESQPFYPEFTAIAPTENNTWGQLIVRLEEIRQSYLLAKRFNDPVVLLKQDPVIPVIETANGTARLVREQHDHYRLETPSLKLAALIPEVVREQELSDALLSIAALNVSPWELHTE